MRRTKQQRLLEERLTYQLTMLLVDLATTRQGIEACTRLLEELGEGYELPDRIAEKLFEAADRMVTMIDKIPS